MNSISSLPRPIQPFITFPHLLRAHGFAISPDQTMSFIEAIELLGPRSVLDIRNAAVAMLAIERERQHEFDGLFRAFFLDHSIAAPVAESDEDDVQAYEEQDGEQIVDLEEDDQNSGTEATSDEILARREFTPLTNERALIDFARRAEKMLPQRRSHRRMSVNSGTAYDLRRSLREAVKRDGELFDLHETRRRRRQRPLVLLIDVSGSMQEQSEQTMRFAHAVKMKAERCEIFTFGTRLTRVTKSLSDRNPDRALERVARLVADFDGGTRIGDALNALLSVPRFAGTLRGASVVIVSDGLERGDPAGMITAVQRISRLSWRLDWLSPLAGDKNFVPRTEALTAILPWLDDLSSGASIADLCSHILNLNQPPRFAGARSAA